MGPTLEQLKQHKQTVRTFQELRSEKNTIFVAILRIKNLQSGIRHYVAMCRVLYMATKWSRMTGFETRGGGRQGSAQMRCSVHGARERTLRPAVCTIHPICVVSCLQERLLASMLTHQLVADMKRDSACMRLPLAVCASRNGGPQTYDCVRSVHAPCTSYCHRNETAYSNGGIGPHRSRRRIYLIDLV